MRCLLGAALPGEARGLGKAHNAAPALLPGQWPRETRAYVARILRRFGGPATLAATTPLAAADAASPGGGTEVSLLP